VRRVELAIDDLVSNVCPTQLSLKLNVQIVLAEKPGFMGAYDRCAICRRYKTYPQGLLPPRNS
jgi:hypothetical protein